MKRNDQILEMTRAELAEAQARIRQLEAELERARAPISDRGEAEADPRMLSREIEENRNDMKAILDSTVAALRESEIRYRSVVQKMTELVCRYDLDHRITFANEAYCNLFEISKQDVIGLSIYKIIPESDHDEARVRLAALNAQNPLVVFTHSRQMPDGSIHWFEWQDQAICNDSGQVVAYQGVGRDVTERIEAANALRASQTMQQAILSALPDQVFHVHSDGTVLDYHGPMQEFFLPVSDLKGMKISDLMNLPGAPREIAESALKMIQLSLQERQIMTFEHELEGRGYYEFRIAPIEASEDVIITVRNITETKRAQDALRRSEAQYRSLVDSSDAAISMVNRQGVYLYVNRIAAVPFGIEPEALVGKRVVELFPADQSVAILLDVTHVIDHGEGKVLEAEVKLNDRMHWFRTSIQPVMDDDGNSYAALIYSTDITENKHAEQEIQRQNAILQQSRDLFAISDHLGRLIYMNQGGLNMVGARDASEVIGKLIPDFHAPEDAQLVMAEYLPQAIEQGYWRGENRLRTLDGRIIHVDQSIFPIHYHDRSVTTYASIMSDISDRKRMEDALRQSERYLRSIIDSQTSFNVRIGMDGRIKFCNTRYKQEFGWYAEELIGQYALNLVLPEDRDLVTRAVESCQNNPGRSVLIEVRKPTKRGGVLYTLWEFIALENDAGQVAEVQCVGFDITDLRDAEVAVRQSEVRYRQMFEVHALPKLIIDPETARIVDANSAAGRFYGFDVETLKQKTMFDISISSPEEIMSKMGAANDAEMLSCQFRHRGAGNVEHAVEIFTGPVEVNGKRYLYSIVTDVTEREKAQQALEEANLLLERRVTERTSEMQRVKDRLEAIFNHSGDAIVLLDVDHGIQQANYTFHTLFDLVPDSYYGKKLSDFFVLEDAVKIERFIRNVARSSETMHLDARAYRSDATLFDVEISVAPINRTESDVVNLVCIIRDITERIQAQSAIAEERYLLRTLIDAVPDFIYVKDLKHRMLLNNRAHAMSIGLKDPAEMLGKTDLDFFPQEMALKFFQDEDEVMRTGVSLVNREEISLGPDGSPAWVMSTKVPLRTVGGELRGIVGITHDITALKTSEQALVNSERRVRESEQMLQSVLDTIPVRVYWKDRNCMYMGCNRLYAQDAGLQSKEQIYGKRDKDLPWAQYAAEHDSVDGRVIESGEAILDEEQKLLADGRQIVIRSNKLPMRDSDGNIIGMLGSYIDVTARMEAEEALRASEEKFRTFIETAPIATVISDQIGMIRLVNRAAETLFGYSREQLIAQPIDMLVPERSRDMHNASRSGYVHESHMRRKGSLEVTALRRNGSEFPVDIQLSYVDLTPAPLVMSFIIDSTDRRRYEEFLKTALQQEKELGELKSRFVSTASHEFRNPLATILAATETLLTYRARMDDGQIDTRLNKIRQQVMHLRGIMDEVLQLARIQAGKVDFVPSPANLDELCDEIVEEFDTIPEHSGRIQYICLTRPVLVAFDNRLMRQVVTNFISNALKYSDKSTKVEIQLTVEKNQALFKISDHGIGIPEDDMKRLFEPFHRAANVGTISGTGLGLSITRQAVELHGGSIVVDSEVNLGTTFTMILPALVRRLKNAEPQ